jgi:asparagine synthase (glutamine-hydrolysing)
MCGINGFNWEDKVLIKRMNTAISHRGPDSEGFFVDKVSFGHRRLSIIDLSERGNQPMFNNSGTLCIIFNGEIYNFQEIKDRLKRKYSFRSDSDTEVILAAYETYGQKCIELFNGMFAFCIYDMKKQILFLARDRIGVKPLYYYHDQKSGRFVFSSEIKAILEHDVARELNREALADYMAFQNILDDKTLFEGIRLLQPAHSIVYDLKQKRLTVFNYWDFNFQGQEADGRSKHSKKEKRKLSDAGQKTGIDAGNNSGAGQEIEAYLEEFRKVFKDSVRRHMIADVPVGSYLSGGFDSGSVTAVAAGLMREKNPKARINTFTAKFKEMGFYDETKCSRVLAKKYDCKIHEVMMTPQDFLDGINKLVYHLDEPKVGLPSIAAYFVAKEASKHVTVVLTGHAGDELFAGYPVYKSFLFKSMMKKNPFNIFRAPAFFKLSEMPRAGYYLLFPAFQRETQHGIFIMFNERQRKRLFHPDFYEKIRKHVPSKTAEALYKKGNDDIQNLQRLYLKAYLPSMLIVEDKVSMAHSIEGRIPFCDNETVKFSLNTPLDIKLHDKTLKYIVKEGMRGKLPPEYYNQAKKGFPTPLSLWFRKDLKDYCYKLLLSKRAVERKVFNPDYVKKLLDRHCSSKTDMLLDLVNAARIWSLINMEIWFRLFIDQDKELLKKVRAKS